MNQFLRSALFSSLPVVGAGALTAASGNALLFNQQVEGTSPGLVAWWTILCAVSVGNIWMLRLSASALEERRESTDPALFKYQRIQLFLSAVYVVGCAFRALVPRADVQRFGLFDTWISSVLVGRSVATIAELCFAAQWAMLLYRIAKDADCRFGMVSARLLVPMIVVAEICSWYAVLTTAYIGNAFEESIWAIAAALLVGGLAASWTRCNPSTQPAVSVAIILGVAYVAYMCAVDVPMYATRWLHDEANGREYLSLQHGLWDVSSRWVVTHSWEEWHPELIWMSLYFSVGVWCSLAMVHIPQRGQTESAATVSPVQA
jgi:hypothetical protein